MSTIQLHATPRSVSDAHAAEAILSAVVYGARNFMNESDTSNLLVPWLEQLGVATASHQVRIFANDPAGAGMPVRASLRAQWIAPGMNPGSPFEALQHVSYEAVGCGRWAQLLSQGVALVGNLAEFPESERPILMQEGLASVAIVPVFADARWWGFIGFSDCMHERTWSEAVQDALGAAAGIYGAALAREQMQQRIVAALTQEQLAREIGEVLTSSSRDLDETLQLCSARIEHHLQADWVRVWALDRAETALKAKATPGAIDQTDFPAEIAWGVSGVGTLAETKRAQVWRGTVPELWPGSLPVTTAAGLTSGAGHPLLVDGNVVGVVVMLTRAEPSSAALDGLASVTDELALAIQRSRALSALGLTEDRFRRLVEATLEGICIHDGKRIIDCNPSLAAMVGFDVSEVIGRSPLDFMHPDSRAEAMRHIATNYTHAYEAMMQRRDGSVVPVEIKGGDFAHDGIKLRVVSVRDLTERKEAERTAARLREEQVAREQSERSRANAEFLVEASRVLASSFDTSTTLTQLAHLSVPFLGDSCVVSLVRHGIEGEVAAVHAALNGAETPASGTGDTLTVPIASGGELLGSIRFTANVAHGKYSPEEESIALELGRRAAVALQSAQSYHDARAATAARDEMLAVVAHDLRNPLNTIYMGSSLALELIGEQAATPGRRQLEIIQRTAEHMNRLIQDLLDATRLEAGQLALEMAPTRPSAIIADALEMLLPLAQYAGITLETKISEVPPIRVDRLRLLQVLSNLVGNAIKFTPRDGRIILSVTAREHDVQFCVSDTGSGIAADQLPHIFGRFWQARSTDRRGLGLGLAIAKGIVEAHGGTIWVESTLGAGSSFLFTVPA